MDLFSLKYNFKPVGSRHGYYLIKKIYILNNYSKILNLLRGKYFEIGICILDFVLFFLEKKN